MKKTNEENMQSISSNPARPAWPAKAWALGRLTGW
jgi:hypothetical protein